ncbi:MAG: hypothetical protein M0P13_02615 [Fibrobacteraceae bacterium]|nr:hypothetical protein [Fibrobacteraceae bacterium]
MTRKSVLLFATTFAAIPLFAEDAAPTFSVSGEVDAEANMHYKQVDPRTETNYQSDDTQLLHDYSSTFNILFSIKFNDKWSAEAAISADDVNTAPGFAYDGAFVQYTASDKLSVKIGDMTYAEGAFRYYDYDDTGDNAIGMIDHGVRGVEVDYAGLTVGLGLGTDDDDCQEETVDSLGVSEGGGCTTYDVHAAYDLAFAGQTIRPYVNYKSYQVANGNALRAGVVATLAFGDKVNLQAVYGLYSNSLKEDSPKMSHTLAVEPELTLGKFSLKATAFYAILDDDDPTPIDVPEYMFGYVEPGFAVTDLLTIGLPVEYHTMSLDDDADLGQVFVGPKVYLAPTGKLSFEAYARAFIPTGDDYKDINSDDPYYGAGASFSLTF